VKIILANKFYFLRGGAEQYLFRVSDYLESRGHTVVPFAMRHPQNLPSVYAPCFPSFVETEKVRFNLSGIKTIGRMLYSFEAKRRMKDLIEDVRPDLCHIHNIYTQLSPSILDALRAKRIPVVMTVHDYHLVSPSYTLWIEGRGPDVRKLGILAGARTRFHKHSFAASLAQIIAFRLHRFLGIYRHPVSRFICPSKFMRDQMQSAGFPSEKLVVNPYGIASEKYIPRFDHDGYVLFVGRLSEEKGVETVIAAASALPEIRFKIAGTGPQEEYLHTLAHACSNVEFLGFQSGEALADLYRGAAMVLLPSQWHEVSPLVMLEAMAYGKPMVASHVGGVPEVVTDRETGLLVSPMDIHGWIEAIARLWDDHDLRESLGRNARAATEGRFHARHHWERLEEIYKETLAHL